MRLFSRLMGIRQAGALQREPTEQTEGSIEKYLLNWLNSR